MIFQISISLFYLCIFCSANAKIVVKEIDRNKDNISKHIVKSVYIANPHIDSSNYYSSVNQKSYFRNFSRKSMDTFSYQSFFSHNPDILYKNGFYVIKSDWHTMRNILKENWVQVANGYMNICKKIENQPNNTPITSKILEIGNVGNVKKICDDLKHYGNHNGALRSYFIKNFTPYLVGDDEQNTNAGLFTGYYYPMLTASRKKTSVFKYPIYRKPPELTSKPYYTRNQIDKGVLNGRGLELYWVDDFVDLYYLHIQGSGMLKLTDGSEVYLQFAGKNNREYQSLGKYMLSKGYVKSGNNNDIKSFLKRNEKIAYDILGVNKSYVFFAESKSKGVIGAHGSELTDTRSLAVDNNFIPYGAILYVDTKNHAKTMFAQDTGAAIKGKIRGDIFIGKGEEAGERAKITHSKGFMYIVVHKDQKLALK